ncbi:BON domain-containing protein [Magnetospira sp. QH-2]|uniref:BON domain-containing protein n=1 Tax=Magnetospira sp. (strain QH-2) TaxID=1288970 RepID=UPI0003E8120A|nr:BON domain-containing protein [Magnetospira sp. QH-2]CCQ72198.1 conserved periplasmic protein of unknown function [Magnetospira sp. QH-2]
MKFATLLAAFVAFAIPAQAFDLNPLSAIKGMVEAAVEDRSTADIATDATIKAEIVAEVIDKMGTDVISITADVYEQTVMLTGIVETMAQKTEAGRLTRTVGGVKKLYNEILVKSDLERDKGTVEGFVDDTVIETKINAQFLDASGVNVTNFRWHSLEGHVFLFGRALSRGELDKATGIARGIDGVRKVTSRVAVRPRDN